MQVSFKMHVFAVAAVAVTFLGNSTMGAPIGQLTNEIFQDSGPGGGYAKASAIPVNTSGDLLLNQAALSTNYVGNNEAAGGTTAPFTDGLTATDGNSDVSQPTSKLNALFDLGAGPQPWYVEYKLGSAAGGYNLTAATIISGHQDSRLNQQYDILVSSDGVNFTSLSDGTVHGLGGEGSGFSYTPSNGDGGAASSTVSPIRGANLATNVEYIEFVDNSNGGNDIYREFAAYGVAVPEPSSVVAWVGLCGMGLIGLLRYRKNLRSSQA